MAFSRSLMRYFLSTPYFPLQNHALCKKYALVPPPPCTSGKGFGVSCSEAGQGTSFGKGQSDVKKGKAWIISPYKSAVTTWSPPEILLVSCGVFKCLGAGERREFEPSQKLLVWGFNSNPFTSPVKHALQYLRAQPATAHPEARGSPDSQPGKQLSLPGKGWKSSPAHTWGTPSLGGQTALEMLLVSFISCAVHNPVTLARAACFNFALVLLEKEYPVPPVGTELRANGKCSCWDQRHSLHFIVFKSEISAGGRECVTALSLAGTGSGDGWLNPPGLTPGTRRWRQRSWALNQPWLP